MVLDPQNQNINKNIFPQKVENSTLRLRKLRVNWDKLPFCLLDVWVPDLGSQQSKFLSALFWANLNYTLLSKQFISKLYISTLLVNKNSLLRSFLAIPPWEVVRWRSWVRILSGAWRFFFLIWLRFPSGRPLVAKIYPIDVVKLFWTLKFGLKTSIFEFKLLSTTEVVYLSWKFHLALFLTMPGS